MTATVTTKPANGKAKENGQVPPAPPTEAEANGQKRNMPNLFAYATVPNGRTTRIGSRIGVVFNHRSGEGFTVYLDAVPIPMDGQIEIVCYPPRPDAR